MNINAYLTIAASTVLAAACSTNNIQKNHAIAKTGLTYVEQVDKLLDEALDVTIDVDSTELWLMRGMKNDKSMLSDKNREIAKFAKEVHSFRKSNNNTRRYFQALEALINNPNQDAMSNSIGEISSAIAKENHRQKSNTHTYESYSHKEGYIHELSQMAVDAHYAKRIQIILHRDKTIIGRHLSYQEEQLQHIASVLKSRLKTAEILHSKMNVEKPYLGKDRLLLDTWKANRRELFEMQQTTPNLEELLEAQQNLKKAWEQVVRGNTSMIDVSHMLSDTSRIANTIRDLDTAPQSIDAL
jgi:hypothetical protein